MIKGVNICKVTSTWHTGPQEILIPFANIASAS